MSAGDGAGARTGPAERGPVLRRNTTAIGAGGGTCLCRWTLGGTHVPNTPRSVCSRSPRKRRGRRHPRIEAVAGRRCLPYSRPRAGGCATWGAFQGQAGRDCGAGERPAEELKASNRRWGAVRQRTGPAKRQRCVWPKRCGLSCWWPPRRVEGGFAGPPSTACSSSVTGRRCLRGRPALSPADKGR